MKGDLRKNCAINVFKLLINNGEPGNKINKELFLSLTEAFVKDYVEKYKQTLQQEQDSNESEAVEIDEVFQDGMKEDL
jgi:hypothetical protein